MKTPEKLSVKSNDKQNSPKKAGVTGSGKTLELELFRSTCNTPTWMRMIVRSLGLRKTRDKRQVLDNPAIRGMVKRVPHLVSIKEL